MSVRLRLKRVGMTKQAHYRLVAVDRRAACDAAELEVLGHYDPRSKENAMKFNNERIQYWMNCGAQPSDTVRSLLARNGLKLSAAPKPEAS